MDVETALHHISQGGGQQFRYLMVLCFVKVYAAFHTIQYSFVGRASPFYCNTGNVTLTNHCPGNMVSECSSITFQDTTIVSEWNLVCDRNWMDKVTMSALMFGCLIGALVLGKIADILGRKATLMVVLWGLIIFNSISALTDTFAVYIISRFLVGFFVSGQLILLAVLVSEMVGPAYRGAFGMAIQVSYPVGIIALAITARFYQNWRDLGRFVSLLGLPFLACHWYLVESPVWLVAQNRLKEAEAALASMARDKDMLGIHLKAGVLNIEGEQVYKEKESLLQMFTKKKVSLITIVLCYNWFVNGASYYGMTLAAGTQNMDIYTGTAWSGAVEIPAVLLAYFAIEQRGRKLAIVGFMSLSGIASLLVLMFSGSTTSANQVGMLFGLLGKMCIGASFKIANIISGEIFPTSMRTSGLGVVSAMGRVGSTLSPFIVMVGESCPGLEFVIFAFLGISGGFLSLQLPETRGKKLPCTVADLIEGERPKTVTI